VLSGNSVGHQPRLPWRRRRVQGKAGWTAIGDLEGEARPPDGVGARPKPPPRCSRPPGWACRRQRSIRRKPVGRYENLPLGDNGGGNGTGIKPSLFLFRNKRRKFILLIGGRKMLAKNLARATSSPEPVFRRSCHFFSLFFIFFSVTPPYGRLKNFLRLYYVVSPTWNRSFFSIAGDDR